MWCISGSEGSAAGESPTQQLSAQKQQPLTSSSKLRSSVEPMELPLPAPGAEPLVAVLPEPASGWRRRRYSKRGRQACKH